MAWPQDGQNRAAGEISAEQLGQWIKRLES